MTKRHHYRGAEVEITSTGVDGAGNLYVSGHVKQTMRYFQHAPMSEIQTVHVLPANTRLCDINLDNYHEGDALTVEDAGIIAVQIIKCPVCGEKYLRCQVRADARCSECAPWPF